MTVTDVGTLPETLYVNYGWLAWTLKDSVGRTVAYGSKGCEYVSNYRNH